MKELSIEEKAKAYDGNYKAYTELINRLENVKDAIKKQNYGIAMDVLYKPYPEFQITTSTEFAESEDEKIRKSLINYVYCHGDAGDFTKKEFIAWIEKQGEQKPTIIIPNFRVGDNIKTTNEEPLTITKIDEKGYWSEDLFICNFDDATKWELVEQKPAEEYNITGIGSKNAKGKLGEMIKKKLEMEKQNEQKPTELDKSKELSLSLQIQAYLNTASDELYAKGKPLYSKERIEDIHKCMLMWQKLHNAYFYQKPAWNEEDEVHVNSLLKRLEGLCRKEFATTRFAINEDEDWLKSLKDRVQPKQEWSEEDENNILFLTSIIEECFKDKKEITLCGDTVCANFTKEDVIDRLKSLRPQSQWKPSDEQIHYLSWIANIKLGDSMVEQEVSKHLNELLEDLKKLKG